MKERSKQGGQCGRAVSVRLSDCLYAPPRMKGEGWRLKSPGFGVGAWPTWVESMSGMCPLPNNRRYQEMVTTFIVTIMFDNLQTRDLCRANTFDL